MHILSHERAALRPLLERYRRALGTVESETKIVRDTKQQAETALSAREFLQNVASKVQTKAHQQIVRVVSKCLSSVFQDPYALCIDFERKRGKTEALFYYTRNDRRIDPNVSSGGVKEIAALALRLAALALTLPPGRKLLVLDEPFLGVSAANMERIAALVEVLAQELDVQFIIATHNTKLHIGNVIEL